MMKSTEKKTLRAQIYDSVMEPQRQNTSFAYSEGFYIKMTVMPILMETT